VHGAEQLKPHYPQVVSLAAEVFRLFAADLTFSSGLGDLRQFRTCPI
jgi:hypothetical protein